MKTALTTLALLVVTGCETLPARQTQVMTTPNGESVATNEKVAQVIVHILGEQAMIADKTESGAFIKELQRTGRWPQGRFQPNAPFKGSTLDKINELALALGGANNSNSVTIERSSKITVRVDVAANSEEKAEHEVVVNKDGYITLPIIRKVKVVGLTPSEAAEVIRQTYIDKEIYKDLTVDVIGETASVYITGEVNTPGSSEYKGGMTLSDLIISSGEVTEFADQKEIKIIRKKKTSIHNYEKILEGKEDDPELKPGDRVIVVRRWI